MLGEKLLLAATTPQWYIDCCMAAVLQVFGADEPGGGRRETEWQKHLEINTCGAAWTSTARESAPSLLYRAVVGGAWRGRVRMAAGQNKGYRESYPTLHWSAAQYALKPVCQPGTNAIELSLLGNLQHVAGDVPVASMHWLVRLRGCLHP